MKYLKTILLMMLCSSARANFTLTVSTLGPKGTSVIISSNPATQINCGSSSTVCAASFASGSTVTLRGIFGSTTTFVGWAGEAGCTNNKSSCKVLMNNNRAVTAKFNANLKLSLYGNGAGTVTDATSTINCSITNGCASFASITQSYSSATHVTLTATPATNSSFSGWSGDCSGSGTCSLGMGASRVVVATFTSAGPFTIRVSTGGTGVGVIYSSPSGIYCGSSNTACSASYALNTSITLHAFSIGNSTFTGWSNAGCASTGTCVIVSTSAQQSLGGSWSPAAYFYKLLQ